MAKESFTNWELLFETLRTNPVPWGRGSVAGRWIVIDQERVNHSTNSVLQWAIKIYPKVQSMQRIREAQRNALKIKELINLHGDLDAWL